MQPRDFGIGRLFSSVRDAVIVGDAATGRVVLWSPAAEALFGYSAGEAIGESIELIVPERLRAAHRAGLARYRDTGQGALVDARAPIELAALRKTGEEVAVELTLSRIGEDLDGGRFVLAIIREVSERKRAEEERLRRIGEEAARARAEAAQRRAAEVLAVADVGRAITRSLDLDSVLQLIVDHAARLFGTRYTGVALTGPEGADVLYRFVAWHGLSERYLASLQPRHSHDGPTACAIAERRPFWSADILQDPTFDVTPETRAAVEAEGLRAVLSVPLLIGDRALGALVVYQETAGPFSTEDVELLRVFADYAAIAIENARLYQEARDAIRLRDEFLSVAAHELKTPMTTLRGHAQLALRQLDRAGGPAPPQLRRALWMIDQQTGKLARLVGQLLGVSRIEMGRLALSREVADIAGLVRDVVAGARVTTAAHTFTVRAPARAPALVDPLRLEQVLTNLVDNAIKYNPGGGPIDVEVATPSTELVRIAVTDRGLGIPREHRGQIFDRFHQAHGDDHRSGMGLGLYISRQIVELHGGRIEAEFPPEGGTRFIVELPTGLGSPVAAEGERREIR